MGGDHRQALHAPGFCIRYTGCQQLIGIPLALAGAGDPEAVDVHIARRLNGHPGIFRRDVLNKAFAPDIALEKYQSFFQPVPQPLFFAQHLGIFVAGYGAADVLAVQVLACQFNVVHRSPPFV